MTDRLMFTQVCQRTRSHISRRRARVASEPAEAAWTRAMTSSLLAQFAPVAAQPRARRGSVPCSAALQRPTAAAAPPLNAPALCMRRGAVGWHAAARRHASLRTLYFVILLQKEKSASALFIFIFSSCFSQYRRHVTHFKVFELSMEKNNYEIRLLQPPLRSAPASRPSRLAAKGAEPAPDVDPDMVELEMVRYCHSLLRIT